jgi:hypothetical protein
MKVCECVCVESNVDRPVRLCYGERVCAFVEGELDYYDKY